MQVIPLHLPPGDTSTERSLHIDGTSEQIKNARELVDEVISEVCLDVDVKRKAFPQFKLFLLLFFYMNTCVCFVSLLSMCVLLKDPLVQFATVLAV